MFCFTVFGVRHYIHVFCGLFGNSPVGSSFRNQKLICERVAFSMQREAYVARCALFSGLYVLTALISPIVPMDIRSSVSGPEANFLTIWATRRRLCSISRFLASILPCLVNCSSRRFSSSGLSGLGKPFLTPTWQIYSTRRSSNSKNHIGVYTLRTARAYKGVSFPFAGFGRGRLRAAVSVPVKHDMRGGGVLCLSCRGNGNIL